MNIVLQVDNCGSPILDNPIDDVADRQYADAIPLPENREVPHASVAHERHAFFNRVIRTDAWNRRFRDFRHHNIQIATVDSQWTLRADWAP
jgi:hypothetical protein